MHITSQPYLKTYTFTPLSVATSIKISLIILSISLPFFITYSTPSNLFEIKISI